MTIVVHSPGMLTTVQDLGRPGHGIEGVSRAGAADAVALQAGNRLAGNAPGAPALEMTLLGGTFEFPEGARVALAGGAPAALPVWEAIDVPPGGMLRIGPIVTGARCYLCVRGGIGVAKVAGSASTHLPSGLGPAPLRKGDVLPIGTATAATAAGTVPEALRTYRRALRVTRGPQAGGFDESVFYGAEYTVATDSNRMGLRLEGPAVPHTHDGRMVTEGVPLGAVQIPANGQPIVLFVDQQTTGGYPKIANVITADLPSVAQLRPRDTVRFSLVSPAEARAALLAQSELLRRL